MNAPRFTDEVPALKAARLAGEGYPDPVELTIEAAGQLLQLEAAPAAAAAVAQLSWAGEHKGAEDVALVSSAGGAAGPKLQFACAGCGRACGVLHLLTGRWRCRSCHGLRYRSQSQSAASRRGAELAALEAELACGRPPGQHQKTFAAKQARAAALREALGHSATPGPQPFTEPGEAELWPLPQAVLGARRSRLDPDPAPEPARGGPGRRPYHPSRAHGDKVIEMGLMGVSRREMARRLGISPPTLEKYYAPELETFTPEVRAEILSGMTTFALEGHFPAIKMWLETFMDWGRPRTERKAKDKPSGPGNAPLPLEPPPGHVGEWPPGGASLYEQGEFAYPLPSAEGESEPPPRLMWISKMAIEKSCWEGRRTVSMTLGLDPKHIVVDEPDS